MQSLQRDLVCLFPCINTFSLFLNIPFFPSFYSFRFSPLFPFFCPFIPSSFISILWTLVLASFLPPSDIPSGFPIYPLVVSLCFSPLSLLSSLLSSIFSPFSYLLSLLSALPPPPLPFVYAKLHPKYAYAIAFFASASTSASVCPAWPGQQSHLAQPNCPNGSSFLSPPKPSPSLLPCCIPSPPLCRSAVQGATLVPKLHRKNTHTHMYKTTTSKVTTNNNNREQTTTTMANNENKTTTKSNNLARFHSDSGHVSLSA